MIKLNELFDVIYGQREYTSKKALKNGEVPLISSKGTQFGVYGFYDIEPKYNNVISVPRTGTICYAFYQKNDCCIDDNCLVLIPKKKLTENEMIYYSLLIRKEKYKYMYGRQVTPKRLGETIIPDEIPTWVHTANKFQFDNFDKSITDKSFDIGTTNWCEFKYADLFEIKSGKGPSIAKAKKHIGIIPLITATEKNNGVSLNIDFTPTHSSNVLTVTKNGSIGEAFYQSKPFCASSDIAVFEPKFELNQYIAFFLITLIKKEKYRFNYGLKWNLNRMKESVIKLPVDKSNQPDWEWIEEYVKSLKYSKNIE